jgi:outer membrane receptor protein involved in Fe transport
MRDGTIRCLAAMLAAAPCAGSQEPLLVETNFGALQELLETKVTLASKKPERISDASASITSYSGTFIQETGNYTLGDLAQITPGYSTYQIYGEQVFETRGQKAGSFNNNLHLLLVDGIPVNGVRNNRAFTEEDLPLQFAERVEFLRGPASSLYGIGAFYGVVSVTPKEAPEGTQVETLLGGGSDARAKRLMTTVSVGDEHAETLLSLGYFNKGDSLAFAGTKDSPDNLYRDGRTALFLRMAEKIKDGAFQGLTIGAMVNYKTSDLGENWMGGTYTSPVDQLTWSTVIPYLKYERALTGDLKFDGYLKYNETDERGGSTPFAAPPTGFSGTGTVYSLYDIKVADYEALAEVTWTPSPALDLIAGLNLDTRWQKGAGDGGFNIAIKADPGDPYPGTPVGRTGDYRTLSAFAQSHLQVDFLAGLTLTGGLRLDEGRAPGNIYRQLSPRMSLVQKLNESFNLKVMYGTALYAPGIKEVEYNNEKKSTHPTLILSGLGAESFRTTEVAGTYTGRFLNGSLTWFTNRTMDSLDPVATLAGSYQNNAGITRAHGYEAELHAALPGRWKGWANYSWAKAESPLGLPLPAVPENTGSAGASRTFSCSVPLEFSAQVRRTGPFRVNNPALPQPPGSTFVDLRLGLVPLKRLGASVEVRNLANKAMKYPAGNLPNVPAPGRSMMFNLWMRL